MGSALTKVYPTSPERRGVTGKSVIEAANEAVTVEEIASGYTGLKQHGERLRGRCPVHGGSNETSFSVSPSEGLWHCHSCGAGGDAVRLAKLLEGHERDDQAAAELLLERGLEIPARPESWHRKNDRQKPLRDGADNVRARIVQRRMFRIFRAAYLDAVEDEKLKRSEAEHIWRELEAPAKAYAWKLGASQ